MTLNKSTIENAVYEWISYWFDPLGIPVIFAYQNSPVPTGSYIVVNIVTMSRVNSAEKEYTDLGGGELNETLGYLSDILISINAYRTNAFDILSGLRFSIEAQATLDIFIAEGLGYHSVSEIRHIPEEIDEQWVERAQFDVYFYMLEEGYSTVEAIQEIEITNELDGSETIIS